MGALVRTEGLTKHFGDTVALEDLDLSIDAGEVFGYLGPNGAGKTTTVRLLLGLLRPTRGRAAILGMDVVRDAVALHRRIAYCPGEFSVWPNLTGAQMLSMLGSLHGAVDEPYRDRLIERFDFDPSKKGRTYSKGNRQKIALIAALMTRAEVLILDEPTAGLDPLMEITFRRCAREAAARGQVVFLSSHILSEVEAICDRVGILRRGRLVDVLALEHLRNLAAHTVDISFAGTPPDLSAIPGVTVLSLTDGTAHCQVRGAMGAFLKAVSAFDVASLVSAEPSLEEVFLTYYGDGEDDA